MKKHNTHQIKICFSVQVLLLTFIEVNYANFHLALIGGFNTTRHEIHLSSFQVIIDKFNIAVPSYMSTLTNSPLLPLPLSDQILNALKQENTTKLFPCHIRTLFIAEWGILYLPINVNSVVFPHRVWRGGGGVSGKIHTYFVS